MATRTFLITGGAGFIGSNLCRHVLKNFSDVHLINLDKLTYAASLDNLRDVETNPRYTFIQGDICDPVQVRQIFDKHQINGVFHLAAESHVDNSIAGPKVFIDTNVGGTFVLLEEARRLWMQDAKKLKPEYQSSRFLHVSTDEVYGSLGPTGAFTETTPYQPSSPYSASKAASDHLVRAWAHTYGMPCVTTNCSNNYGPFQHHEKLIPTVIRKALAKEPIPIYGNGRNVRDWLFVEDHCRALTTVYTQGIVGETYNIGGNCERQNIDLAKQLCAILDNLAPRPDSVSYAQQIEFVTDRLGHDWRYAIDSTKICNQLGWRAEVQIEAGLRTTVEFYLNQLRHK